MAAKAILFLLEFAFACAGAVYAPLVGIVAYTLHYVTSPERQRWGASVSHWGIRYSFILAVFTAVGIALHHRGLRYGKKILIRQECLLIGFVALVWLSHALWAPGVESYRGDHPGFKMTKILIFALMLTHVVTTLKRVKVLFWGLTIGIMFLGYQAYTADPNMFVTGRLNAIGGADFHSANFLAAYLAACLPIIAVQFMTSGWIGKAVCLVAGGLSVNTIV